MAEAFATERLNTPDATAEQLRQHIDAIRKLKADQKDLSDALALRFAQAKSEGFDKDVLRVVVKRLDSDRKELAEADSLLALYERWYHEDMEPADAALLRNVRVSASRERARESFDA